MSRLQRVLCRIGLHRMRVVRDTGLHAYVQCERCEKRRCIVLSTEGMQPRDDHWVRTGEWYQPPMPDGRER